MRRAPAVELDALLTDLLVGLRLGPVAGARPAGGDDQAGTRAAGGDDHSEAGAAGTEDPSATAVLDAASAFLSERGLRHWTVDDVAERAGVGRATVYRRFASRDDLMKAAITRDARRFFAAVAGTVRQVEPLDEKVVGGFVAGLRLARSSPLTSLLRRDPAAALSLLTSESLLRTATEALTERYEAMSGTRLGPRARARAEAAAEALVRLGLSFVLVPGPTADLDSDRGAREHLASIIRPLVSGRS